jgi:4'-phosphopantetheinyl transferase EntD
VKFVHIGGWWPGNLKYWNRLLLLRSRLLTESANSMNSINVAPPGNPARLSPELTSLFPAAVFAAEMKEPGDPTQLLPGERGQLGNAVPKRIQEFAAGRLCARRVLEELCITDFPLRIADDRQPIWPSHVAGSITHTNGYCIAVAGLRELVGSVGIDCEADLVPEEIWPTICTGTESAWIASLSPLDRGAAVTFLFSAKESFYKCQYAVTREWIDFRDISIRVTNWGTPTGGFAVTANRPLSAAKHCGKWSGRYLLRDSRITTGIAMQIYGPPGH